MPWWLRILAGLVVVFVAIQFVPYGRDHDNPRSVEEPAWDSSRTRQLAVAACFDCHSNLTEWPWYTEVAPFSWLTARDVTDGREVLNFSEWHLPQEVDVEAVVDVLRDGEMPPFYYTWVHRNADLSSVEQQELETGLLETWSASPPGGDPAP